MAIFFYKSWKNVTSTCKSLESKILKIEISESGNSAIITVKDIIVYKDYTKREYISKTKWVKIGIVWYRAHGKSELYEDGKRVR